MNTPEQQAQYDIFAALHEKFDQYVSGPWWWRWNTIPTATLDGDFTADQLREIATALDLAKNL